MKVERVTDLEKLGLDDEYLKRLTSDIPNEFNLARVVAVHKDSFMVSKGSGDILAELNGKMIFQSESPQDFPTVGDWVLATFYDDDTFAIIHEVLERKSLLKRKTSGKRINYQLIGANIDFALIVQSLDFNYNPRRLERYLAMIEESGITPVILFSKSDLIPLEEIKKKVEEIEIFSPTIKVYAFSNLEEDGTKSIEEMLVPGKTYCLLGSSGVGKTTLLNNLLNNSKGFATQEVSKKENKGRHTTTTRHLLTLYTGSLIIDTPGMRELGNISLETGLDETFSEIADLSGQCRFSDCNHMVEKGCAILEGLKSGQISPERYNNYMKLRKETAYHESSYREKRQKDKEFGKHCKTVMKHKKQRR